jgi:peptidyl-prolyl cis-trans isomerase B (cyclophilin B)
MCVADEKKADAPKEPAQKVIVKMTTSLGDMYLELDGGKAPQTVKNFLAYADDGFYEGTIFHRVMKGFMAQGGGFTPDYERKATKQAIPNEADNGLKNDYGTIAMARTTEPHSATSQFFINCKDNTFLNHQNKTPRGWGYCVFGKLIAGKETLEKIRNTQVVFDPKADARSPARPVTPVVIEKVTRVAADDEGLKKAIEADKAAETK